VTPAEPVVVEVVSIDPVGRSCVLSVDGRVYHLLIGDSVSIPRVLEVYS
jgi:hypothetical protein